MDKCLYNYLFVFFLVFSLTIEAQNDTIRFKDNTTLTGEIKSLSTGILTMETDFSDKDFKIEFNKVEEIIISRKCIINLTNSRRYYGNIRSETPGTFTIFFEDGTSTQFKMDEMTGLIVSPVTDAMSMVSFGMASSDFEKARDRYEILYRIYIFNEFKENCP